MSKRTLLGRLVSRIETFWSFVCGLWRGGRGWAVPILIGMLIALILVLAGGNVGVSGLIYPLF